jgi:hypothetical protein
VDHPTRLTLVTWSAALLLGSGTVACSSDESSIIEPPGPTAQSLSASLRTLIGPGQHAAVSVDARAQLQSTVNPTPALTTAGEQAVARAPAWVRQPLRLRLGMVDAGLQDELAALVLDAPDERVVDEIAFSIANLPELSASLAHFDPALITENALALYAYDERVAYAEIVDTGSPGDDDYWSTVRYTMLDDGGQPTTYDLPRELYYWYVAHPVVEVDDLLPVDPGTGHPADAPAGVHWRRYVMDSSTATFDYRNHYLLLQPNDLTGLELGLSASAHLDTPNIYPLRVFVDELGNGLLTETDLGTGTLLASTLSLAEAYAAGTTGPLANLVTYGNTNVTLTSAARVALLMDETPWGSDVYSAALASKGITPEIHPVADLATLDLASFDKIIVASDQSAAFYAAVAARSAELEAWIAPPSPLPGGVLELDLHASADLSALSWPNGITTAGGAPAEVRIEGQPLLADTIGSATAVWDGVAYPDLSGDRPPPTTGLAMDVIGWFVSQNLFDNVTERSEVSSSVERTQYPQRIVHNHYGNCGEIADLMAAAGRAALLPVRNVIEVEDHTWNEVWVAGRWVPWQVDWSDSSTRIDSAAVGYDRDHGGSKDLSGLLSIRGDGYVGEWPGATYTDTATIEITVHDTVGRPIDGAVVVLFTENFYTPTDPAEAEVARTDPTGAVSFVVGNGRNYWLYVGSAAGGGVKYPGELHDPLTFAQLAKIAADTDTTPGAVITKDVALDVDLAPLTAAGPGDPGDGLGTATVSAELRSSYIVAGSLYASDASQKSLGHVIIDAPGVTLRYYLLDQPSYDAFAAGQPFLALAAAEDATALTVPTEAVPSSGALWLVAYNPSVSEAVEVELALEGRAP